MARKNDGILELLMELPWWVSVALSAMVYFGLTIMLPAVELQSPAFKGLQTVLPAFAPLFGLLLLVPAPISAFNSWRKKKLLDTQKDVVSIRDLPWREFEELVYKGSEPFLTKRR